MQRIDIRSLTTSDTPGGSAEGRAVLAQLVTRLPFATDPTVLFLDFDRVAVATGSFLREGPLALRHVVRAQNQPLYPIIANARGAVVDELALYAKLAAEVIPCCDLTATGEANNARLIGDLDPKQAMVFEEIARRGVVTARALLDESSDDVGITAWNNRLAGLAEKGLVIESMRGRSKVYQSLFANWGA